MRYPTATVLGLILLAAFASRAAAASFGGVLKVIEIAEHEQDPWALVRLHDVEDQISEHGQRIENLKRERFTNRDEARQHSEKIKQHREQIVALKRKQRELRRQVGAGMTEIRGWLGLKGSEIVIECRGRWRKEAKRLQVGAIVDFVAEQLKQRRSPAYGQTSRHWISPLDLEVVQTTPVGWTDAPTSDAFSWSRVDLTTSAELECKIKAVAAPSGWSLSVVDIKQIKPSLGSYQHVMEVRLRIYAQDAIGQRTALLTPQDGIIVARTEQGKSYRYGPLRTRFTPSVESEHGYQFEIIEVLAEKQR